MGLNLRKHLIKCCVEMDKRALLVMQIGSRLAAVMLLLSIVVYIMPESSIFGWNFGVNLSRSILEISLMLLLESVICGLGGDYILKTEAAKRS